MVSPTTTIDASELAAHEAVLVARVAAGDRGEPIAALYARYGRQLYSLGLQLLGDRGLAEDLVQETFVRLWRSSGRFDPERGSVRTFVYTLARRAAVDLLRRRASRPLTLLDEDEELESLAERPFDALVLGLDVRAALETLSPAHRQILELHYLSDMSQVHIAEQLGIPLGTVKTRTYHALRALRVEFAGRSLDA